MEIGRSNQVYEFEGFLLDPDRQLLFIQNGSGVVPLTPKAFDLLVVLVENRGRLLTKDDLLHAVWPDSFVEEANLTQTISVLRRKLGETPGEHRFIVTETGRGYRFVASVTSKDSFSESETTDSSHRPPHPDRELPTRTPVEPGVAHRPIVMATLVLAAIAVIFAFGYWGWYGGDSQQPESPVRTVAVLPFRSATADGDEQSIALGLTETLVVKLAASRLLVKHPGVLLRAGAVSPDPIKLGGDLQADAVLDGSVQKSGDRIRLTARLIRVRDGTSLWAEAIEDGFTNVFAVQDSISQKVVRTLLPQLTGAESGRPEKRHTDDPEAYLQYYRGKFHWNKYTNEGFEKAIEHFRRAIELDPEYALAHAGLAETYILQAVESYRDPREVCPQARVAADKAVSLDPDLAQAHSAIGMYEIFYGYDWGRAERSFKRAIELDPQNSDARHFYCHLLQALNRHDEAIEQIRTGLRNEPFSLVVNAETGWAYYLARRYDEALPLLIQAKEMEPDFFLVYLPLAQTYIQKSMFAEAEAELKRAAALSSNHPMILSELAVLYALQGREDEALTIAADFEARFGDEFFDPYFVAAIYTALGRKDDAFVWLERSLEVRSNWLLWINAEPKLDPLRDDPRFEDIVERMRLPG